MFIAPHPAPAFDLVVLDPQGRIRFDSANAVAWMDRGEGVGRQGRGIVGIGRSAREALDRLVRETLADAAACRPAQPRVVPLARPGRLPLIAVGLPIARHRRHADFELGVALLLRDPEVAQLPPLALVREAFGLTCAEAEVAIAMGSERSLKEIARLRECSVNTVRTQAARVFMKTGCRRQAEVVRLLGALNEALSAAGGLATGLHWPQAAHDQAIRRHYDALLRLPLSAPPDQHATIVSRGFAPGDDTGYHLHGSGHEIVCVLEGALTMEYRDRAPAITGAGQAIYVPPGVVHRGLNADISTPLTLFHVGIGPAGSIDRRNL